MEQVYTLRTQESEAQPLVIATQGRSPAPIPRHKGESYANRFAQFFAFFHLGPRANARREKLP